MGDTTVTTGQQPTTSGQGDPAATQPNQNTPSGATPDTKPKSDDDAPLGPAGLRALKAERDRADRFEAELKQFEPLKKVAQALAGDSSDGKSEVEKLNERFAEYERKVAEAELSHLREKVARKFELPDDLAEVLKGGTEDELKAHAQVLKKYVPATKETGKQRPKPDRSQGGGDNNGHVSSRQQGLDQAKKRFGTTKTT